MPAEPVLQGGSNEARCVVDIQSFGFFEVLAGTGLTATPGLLASAGVLLRRDVSWNNGRCEPFSLDRTYTDLSATRWPNIRKKEKEREG